MNKVLKELKQYLDDCDFYSVDPENANSVRDKLRIAVAELAKLDSKIVELEKTLAEKNNTL